MKKIRETEWNVWQMLGQGRGWQWSGEFEVQLAGRRDHLSGGYKEMRVPVAIDREVVGWSKCWEQSGGAPD